MKTTLTFLTAAALLLASCAKENKLAKELDGTWQVDYQWAGDANTQPESFTNAATWTLTKCKAKKETCTGVYQGDDDVQISFDWTVLDGADSVSFSVIDDNHWMQQFEGTYGIFSQTESKVVLLSNTCDRCPFRGTYTVTLSK